MKEKCSICKKHKKEMMHITQEQESNVKGLIVSVGMGYICKSCFKERRKK